MRIREITQSEAVRLFTENPGKTIFMKKKVGALTTLGELRISDGFFMIVEDDEPEKEPEETKEDPEDTRQEIEEKPVQNPVGGGKEIGSW